MRTMPTCGNTPDDATWVGRTWMITGPDNPDGTGWSLCYHGGTGKCKCCVASFRSHGDAKHCAMHFNHNRYTPRQKAGKP